MDKNNKQIFDEFILQLKSWYESGKKPTCCSNDLNYAFELQKKRLDSNGLLLKYDYILRSEESDNISAKQWHDQKYTNTMAFQNYLKTSSFFANDKCIYKYKEKDVEYAIITRLMGQDVDAQYVCPNCGAICSVKELIENGCPSCQTHFLMTDLFPKVTNYFSIKDMGYAKNEMKISIGLWLLFGIVTALIITSFVVFNISSSSISNIGNVFEILGKYIPQYIFAAIFGVIGGYLCWAVTKLISVFYNAIKVTPLVAKGAGSKRKITDFMKQYDPNFSYRYFIGKALSLVKMMVFSDDYTNLAVYDGKPLQNTCKDIVDIRYRDVTAVNSCSINGNYGYIDITVFTTNYYCHNQKISKKDESFRMLMCKNIMQPPDYGFSIRKVQCKSCSGSFDASKAHNCPYCGKPYHLGDDDWVVLSFCKI